MHRTLADDLMEATGADFESPSQWLPTQRFVYDALMAVRAGLSPVLRSALEHRGSQLPDLKESEDARVVIWNSAGSDSMGDTPTGAAARATLFAFAPPNSPGDQPGEFIWYFCMFYTRAGLSEESLVTTFHRHWPTVAPDKSLERTRGR